MTALAFLSADTARDRSAPSANAPTRAKRPRDAGPTLGNQAQLRRLSPASAGVQAKLSIGAVDDPLEREADAAADTVMRMADPSLSLSSASPMLSRKCVACEDEEKQSVQRRAEDGHAGHGEAPDAVHTVLSEPGRPLDPATHDFMAQRFGADFSGVRIHDDAAAAASAREIGAHAYTVGDHLVFGQGRYDPAGEDGRRLIAHELAHTIQQGGGAPATLQRAPCRSAHECATPADGDPGQFVQGVAPVQAANDAAGAAAPAGTPVAVAHAQLGLPATNIRAVMAANGIALRPEVFGVFLSPSIEGTVGAQTSRCTQFPNSTPAGAAIRADPHAATKRCIEVPPSLETLAGALLGFAAPGTADQRRDLAQVLSTMTHEMAHARFDDNQVGTITPTADCQRDTVIRNNPDFPHVDHFRVKFYLSEIAGISNQFPIYFNNSQSNQTNADHQLLHDDERNEAFNKQEGIVGAIRSLQCVCSCPSVNDLVTQTVNLAMDGWTPAQQVKFLKVMTRIMPSFWPPALRMADTP